MKKLMLLFVAILTMFVATSCFKQEQSQTMYVGFYYDLSSSVDVDTIVQDTVVIQSKVSLLSIESSISGAIIKGVVEGSSSMTDFAYGVSWGVSPNPTIENNYSEPIRFEKPDRFEITISNLRANTRYYIRPYILKSNQYSYGDKSDEFTTGH